MDILTRLFSVIVNTAVAADVNVGVKIPLGPNNAGASNSYSTWEAYISDIYTFAQYIGVTLAVLMIVYSGILYVTSEGDSTKLSTAKEITIGALIGLAMLFMINFLAKVLGIDRIE